MKPPAWRGARARSLPSRCSAVPLRRPRRRTVRSTLPEPPPTRRRRMAYASCRSRRSRQPCAAPATAPHASTRARARGEEVLRQCSNDIIVMWAVTMLSILLWHPTSPPASLLMVILALLLLSTKREGRTWWGRWAHLAGSATRRRGIDSMRLRHHVRRLPLPHTRPHARARTQ